MNEPIAYPVEGGSWTRHDDGSFTKTEVDGTVITLAADGTRTETTPAAPAAKEE